MKRWDAIVPLVVVALIAGAVYYFRTAEESAAPPVLAGAPSSTGERVAACTELAGEVGARLEACIDQLQTSTLSEEVVKLIDGLADDGKLLTIANLPRTWESQVGLEPSVRESLMQADEAQAAAALRDAGFRGLVVSRDLRGALDDDPLVLARLAYHSHLEWFQLRHVTEDLFVYTVRSSPSRVPLATGEALLDGLRSRLEGEAPTPQRWKPGTVRIMGQMRLQGDMLVIRHAVGSDLERALDDLAAGMRRSWERDAVPAGHGLLDERLDDIRLEVHVVMERAPVEPRSEFAIFDLWQMGIDGMMFKQRPGKTPDKFTYMPGSELVTQSLRSPDAFLRYAVEWGGWHDLRPWQVDKRTQLSIIRTQHFMESEPGGGGAVRLFRGMPEVSMEEMTDKRIQQMLIAGGEWWLHNMDDEGVIEYKYWPTQNRRSTEYNEVRHILATRDLADTWRYRNDDRYLEGSRRAMDWLLRYAVDSTDAPQPPLPHPPDGTLLFRYPSLQEAARLRKPPNQKLGTVAVALLGWVAWADATGSKAEDDRIRRMARFVRAMMDEQGKYRAYFVQEGHPYEKEKNDIVPGEAALSLGMVAEYFDEPEWLDDHKKFIEYYRPWFRERAKKVRPTGRWPRHTYEDLTRLDLVQFGPWSVMANKQYYKMTGDTEAADFGLEVADWMIDYYQWRGDRSPWPDFVGGYYKLPIELPAMQTFCYSEGTAAAYQIAASHAPERKDKYDTSTLEAIRFMEVMQFDPTDSYFVPRPDKVRGGIKYTMNENKVRIDYVGHGLSTLSQYLDAKRADPAVELDVIDPALRATWGPWEDGPAEGDSTAAAPAE